MTAAEPDGARYEAAVAALQRRGRFGIRLGLGRTRALLHALGDPHLDLPGALIGGTNGKGSVQAMIASVLAAAGYRVGQTPSPHLVTYRERLTVDGAPIAPAALADLLEEILAAEERLAGKLGHATEFELLTAAAFLWFRRQFVDLAVVEVGMGGRLDATNAWDGGVAAITNVDLDHTDRLGVTIEAIAREKAAIIKTGDRAVTGAIGPALTVIRRRAGALRVPLREVEPLPVVAMDRGGLQLQHPDHGPLRLGLLGRHQAANAAIAVATLEELAAVGRAQVSGEQLYAGLAEARWPGRLELVALAPGRDLLLDGAHNVAGVEALVAALDELGRWVAPGPPTVVLAMLADKDVSGMLDRLVAADALAGASIITTRVVSPRALAAVDLAAAWQDRAALAPVAWTGEVRAVEPVSAAIDAALALNAERGGLLLVAGSLYLVGEARALLVDDPVLRDPSVPGA